jgi:two-component system chemotaxis response regulator CheB
MTRARLAEGEFPIIALVCSAGGLAALSAVLGRLPSDLPAAVLALQHHSADHVSFLAQILGDRCALPVHSAVDGERLEPTSVVVIPAGHHALVTTSDDIILVTADDPPPYRPSADLLLSSLAIAAPTRTIAVVLSGTGHDAAAGAAVLHRLGGTVVASDAASSTFPEMPLAALRRHGVVDATVPLDQIAKLLVSVVTDLAAAAGAETTDA